jgi:hypothetical protein
MRDDVEPRARVALLVGLVPLVGVAALALGPLAWRRANREMRRGGGMAIGATLLGVGWLFAVLMLVLVQTLVHPTRDAHGSVTATQDVAFDDLRVGDCVLTAIQGSQKRAGSVVSVGVSPCSSPHRSELFARLPLPGSRFPRDIVSRGHSLCEERLPSYAGTAPYDVVISYPNVYAWAGGDHGILCFLRNEDGSDLVGSARSE